jgi:hypothetical protein
MPNYPFHSFTEILSEIKDNGMVDFGYLPLEFLETIFQARTTLGVIILRL